MNLNSSTRYAISITLIYVINLSAHKGKHTHYHAKIILTFGNYRHFFCKQS